MDKNGEYTFRFEARGNTRAEFPKRRSSASALRPSCPGSMVDFFYTYCYGAEEESPFEHPFLPTNQQETPDSQLESDIIQFFVHLGNLSC